MSEWSTKEDHDKFLPTLVSKKINIERQILNETDLEVIANIELATNIAAATTATISPVTAYLTKASLQSLWSLLNSQQTAV